ncbi:mitochondrial chaperone BCS1 [Purpureocillium lavendulum]|uniref:Mitochondrial chaperone BCS1 n=1 Tax=Purpureocillium lavendulum TaxID=1247861 RepID=A0AB34FC96_9HYPO|nr:mitochondrial chaperone BCS1 [Purpureocillium lavendulum]
MAGNILFIAPSKGIISFLEADIGFRKEEEISITSFGRSSELLRQFLEECRDEYLKQIQKKTTIFENRNDRWKKVATRTIRPLSTVIVNEKQKQHLFEDVKTFIAPDTRRWFVERNIPYRRGYLLYGPPGTGKSSFSFSVAGELGIDIYIVNIPDVNDQSLKDLFSELPQQCVVLLEDIDAAGIGRPSDNDDSDGGLPGSRKGVTMSGLLNTLDGVASQEGRVVIMTTNHIDNLDEALIRPGRVDRKVEFQFADADMISQLFRCIHGFQSWMALEMTIDESTSISNAMVKLRVIDEMTTDGGRLPWQKRLAYLQLYRSLQILERIVERMRRRGQINSGRGQGNKTHVRQIYSDALQGKTENHVRLQKRIAKRHFLGLRNSLFLAVAYSDYAGTRMYAVNPTSKEC